MATSPIYNWPEPDNTDLVKNGALAIRTLGNAIDTTMATMTPKSIVDAKGDLIAASAADTPARLAVGNNGETLVADSSTSTGLRWQGSITAGKNFAINGGYDIWQRGTSFAIPSGTTTTFTADRFCAFRTSVGAGMTVSRQASGLTGFNYCLRAQRNAGDTNTQGMYVLGNTIETANSIYLAGQTITLSFYARAGANLSATGNTLTTAMVSGTGTDQFGFGQFTNQATIAAGNRTLTTSWQRFTFTGTVATNATEIAFYCLTNDSSGTAGANDYYEVTGWQVEIGSVATQFSRAGGTIQGELAACKYYYKRITGGSGTGSFTNFGTASSTTQITTTYADTSPMRVVPTSVDYANVAVSDVFGGRIAASSVALDTTFSTSSTFVLNLAVTGATQYRPYTTLSQSGLTGYLGLSAEL